MNRIPPATSLLRVDPSEYGMRSTSLSKKLSRASAGIRRKFLLQDAVVCQLVKPPILGTGSTWCRGDTALRGPRGAATAKPNCTASQANAVLLKWGACGFQL